MALYEASTVPPPPTEAEKQSQAEQTRIEQALKDKIRHIDAIVSMIKAVDANLKAHVAIAPMLADVAEDDRYPIESALYDIWKTKEMVDKVTARWPKPGADIGPAFNPMSLTGLLAMPPKRWLINQLFGRGDLVMLYGPPGCGKSFVAIDMIFAACLGGQFARRFDVAGCLDDTGPLNVAYCAGEGLDGLPARFAAAAQHWGVDDLANFTFFATVPQLYEGEDTAYIRTITRFIDEWKQRQADGQAKPLHILFLDTFHSATAGADENSSQHMGIVLQAAKFAAQELGCAVIMVHHTNKSGTAERGSSSLRGAMDAMIEIKRISDTSTKAVMHCAKLKDGEAWKDQTFDLAAMGDSVRVWWDEPSDASEGDKRKSETAREILELLAEKPDRSLPAKKIAETIAKLPQSVNKVLARLVKDGTVKRSEDKRGTIVFAVTDEGIEALSQPGKV
jgi:predicted transcriptional regulator